MPQPGDYRPEQRQYVGPEGSWSTKSTAASPCRVSRPPQSRTPHRPWDWGYWIVGHGASLSNFNDTLYPQDTRNCQTCHVQTHPGLTEAANFKTVPTLEACGSCHDNVNFATGANHSSNIVANDTQCTTCHGTTSTIDNGSLQVATAHVIPEVTAAAKFQYIVNNVSFTTDPAHNVYPVVNFSVVDPTSGNAPYDILTAAAFVGTDPGSGRPVCADGGKARLTIDVAWETSDYTNWGSGTTAATWGQPFSLNPLAVAGCAAAVPPSAITGPDATGAFTLTSPTALPAPPVANLPACKFDCLPSRQQRCGSDRRASGRCHNGTRGYSHPSNERGQLCERRREQPGCASPSGGYKEMRRLP